MDYCICSKCGNQFPRVEKIKKDGRVVEIDWSVESMPTCPTCRGLKAAVMPKRDVLGGYPPGRKGSRNE
jgi:NAD-dependent SIR2 family protein deacetylase